MLLLQDFLLTYCYFAVRRIELDIIFVPCGFCFLAFYACNFPECNFSSLVLIMNLVTFSYSVLNLLQLSELVNVEGYSDWIRLVAEFTLKSLQSWQVGFVSLMYYPNISPAKWKGGGKKQRSFTQWMFQIKLKMRFYLMNETVLSFSSLYASFVMLMSISNYLCPNGKLLQLVFC